MFGSVSEWFYRWLGGIQPDPDYPGFKKFLLIPAVPKKLEHASSTYISPHGRIVSNWKKSGKEVNYELEIPPGTSAFVKLKKDSLQKIQIKKRNDTAFEPKLIHGLAAGSFELNEGHYLIAVQ
jgi:alpha-L-rhamnosidase